MKFVGLDVGNGSTCIFVRNSDGSLQSKMYPSTYGYYDAAKTKSVVGSRGEQEQSDGDSIDVFSLFQREFVLGYKDVKATGSEPFSTYGREERIHLGPFRTLVRLAILDAATIDGSNGVIEVTLGFGVPNEDYRKDKLDHIAQWFKEPITGTKNGHQVIIMIKNVEFISQPIAVLIDSYNDTDGYVENPILEEEQILVIDSGSGTLDMSEFRGMRLQKQVSEAIGMNDVYQTVIEDIERREPKVRVNAYDLEDQLRDQEGQREFVYRYGTLTIPITETHHQAMEDTWAAMVGRIERRYPDRTRFNRVVLAGGTGDAFHSRFTQWMPQILKTIEPQLAIARGLCKYVVSLYSEYNAETAAGSGDEA